MLLRSELTIENRSLSLSLFLSLSLTHTHTHKLLAKRNEAYTKDKQMALEILVRMLAASPGSANRYAVHFIM